MKHKEFLDLVEKRIKESILNSKDSVDKDLRGDILGEYQKLKVRYPPSPHCEVCFQELQDDHPSIRVLRGNGEKSEAFLCDEHAAEFNKSGAKDLDSFIDAVFDDDSKFEQMHARTFGELTEAFGNKPDVMSFIAELIVELTKPNVLNDLISFALFSSSYFRSYSHPPDLKVVRKLIAKKFSRLVKPFESILKLSLATNPMSPDNLVEWIFTVIREIKLEDFGIFDKPAIAKNKDEASLNIGEYIPGSLEMEIFTSLCDKVLPKILKLEEEVRPYLRKAAENRRIDLQRHELYLERSNKGEEKEFRYDRLGTGTRMFNEAPRRKEGAEEKGTSVFDWLPDIVSARDIEKASDLSKFISGLDDPLDAEIALKYFIERKTIRKTAEEVSLGKSAVSERVKRIRQILNPA